MDIRSSNATSIVAATKTAETGYAIQLFPIMYRDASVPKGGTTRTQSSYQHPETQEQRMGYVISHSMSSG